MSPSFSPKWYVGRTRVFNRGLATQELAMSVCLSVTKTKCKHSLSIPLLPACPRMGGGVYTALLIDKSEMILKVKRGTLTILLPGDLRVIVQQAIGVSAFHHLD